MKGRNEKSWGRCERQLPTVTCKARYVSKCRAKVAEEPTHWLIRDWAIARTMQKVRPMEALGRTVGTPEGVQSPHGELHDAPDLDDPVRRSRGAVSPLPWRMLPPPSTAEWNS